MFANTKFDKQEIGGKLKNPIAFKMWGRERVKVEKSVEKLSQNALFSKFSPQILITEENFWSKNM